MLGGQLRVAIDARYLSHNLVGGIHTYLMNLSRQLLSDSSSQEVVFWVDDKAKFDLQGECPAAAVRTVPWRTKLSSARNDRRLGLLMRRDGADVLHFPANYGVAPPGAPTVITLHDAINVMPLQEIIRGHAHDPRTVAMMTYLHLMTRRAIARQPLVITVSEHAKEQILRYVDLDPDRVNVIYSAPDGDFRMLDADDVADTRRRLGLRQHVLLADAIKNPDATLAAFRLLPRALRDDTSLIFFARRQPSAAVLQAAETGECRLLMRPQRDTLVRLYNLANLFIFPSPYEGFGLPVIESMACGTPVIASDCGSLPEVIGPGGVSVPLDDHLAYAQAIVNLLDDRVLMTRYRKRALQHAAGFSWERAAHETSAVYREAMGLARIQPRQQFVEASVSSSS